ncbi:MAG: lysophospholipid acyltransferase family protein [Verrucomicrobiales bacterium]
MHHPEHMPMEGPALVVSNHASYLDPPLVGCGVKRAMCFMGRESLFRFPVMGAILRSWNSIPIDRDGGGAGGLRAVLEKLNEGHAVMLFPEGTRTATGEMQPARSGVGLVVIKSEAAVVPVKVLGTFEAYSRNQKIPRFRKQVQVVYGKPLHFEALRAEAKTCTKQRLKEIYQEVADTIMAEIAKLQPPAIEDK